MSEDQPKSLIRTLASTLWFPVFFIVGFMVFYLLPMHSPAPHDMPVSVVGQGAAQQLAGSFEQAMPGAVDVSAVPDEQAARESVLDREAIAAYDPADGDLFYAKANGAAMMQVLQQTFAPVASASGDQLQMIDLAPNAPGDTMGTALLYCLLAMNISPYIAVMMLLRAPLNLRQKLSSLVGIGALAAVVCYSVARVLEVVPNQPVLMLVGFLLTQAVAWVTFGLVPIFKQFIPGVAMGLFVLLSMPSSGGAIPKELVPPFFQALHPLLPLGQTVDAMRGIMYFDGAGVAPGVLGLCVWLVVGVGLVAFNEFRARRGGEAEDAEAGGYEHEDEGDAVVDPLLAAPKPVHHRTLAGVVRDASGEPVPGAIITVTDTSGMQLARIVAARDGGYEVQDLPGEHVTVVVSAPGMRPAVDRVHLHAGRTQDHDFALAAEAAARAVPAAR
ncbi:carboxypeptidase regulatory-like domain-containing protein [Saccharopolyspora cebuensis]|uniref:carboxypeptidase regulatory-like domain-containing protein n=1 Tax=Saccharopolyspora cebuensis TaxID=418759 RepID=UPI0031EACF0A